MTSYRVVRRKYANLSGQGAKLYGGRFNPPGVSAVYSSENIALALLEVFVHLDRSEVPKDYVVMAIEFHGQSVFRPALDVVPALRDLTAEAFRVSKFYRACLRVPSVIVPRESNYILFPEAEGFRASVDWIEPLFFDRRLFAAR
jgi:RES domain-containing protein